MERIVVIINLLKDLLLRYAVHITLLIGVAFAAVGYFESESNFQDVERVALFNRAFQDGYISISQPGPGQKLQATKVASFSDLQVNDQQLYGKDRWERMQKLIYRFTTAVNQGLGDPFHYKEDGERSVVDFIKSDSLTYKNPFTERRPEFAKTPINSTQFGRLHDGWRIVSKTAVLTLKPGGGISTLNTVHSTTDPVAGEFVLSSSSDPNTTLRIHTDLDGKLQVLKVDVTHRGISGTNRSVTCRGGDYFVWDGHPYSVFRTGSSADQSDASFGDLVFTKTINGKPWRLQVLGSATANVIGSPVGGETNYIDGALLHEKVQRLVLTLDADIQNAAFHILEKKLSDLDSHHACKLSRKRFGAVTVLDAQTGQILAQAGLPGYDPDWEGSRIVLANRSRLIHNPANASHMPGSSIKVMTAGAGYILFGDGTGNMLPKSINRLAIMQAFRNSYGGAMPPPDIVENTESAEVTKSGEEHFRQHGGQGRLNSEFIATLNSAFGVLQYDINDPRHSSDRESMLKKWSENLVPKDLDRYFETEAKYSFFPEPSRFPIADTDNMEVFRMYAIGGSEARFTTVKLAAILGTVSSNRVIHPFIVESVIDPTIKGSGGRVTYTNGSVFEDIGTVLPDVQGAHNGNLTTMNTAMVSYLQQVCDGSPGTGIYHNSSGRALYMTRDDPDSPEDESTLRSGDYGKTGTANYGNIDEYEDSVFVYRHGRYIVSVWLERADGKGVVHPANDVVDQIVRYIDKLDSHP